MTDQNPSEYDNDNYKAGNTSNGGGSQGNSYSGSANDAGTGGQSYDAWSQQSSYNYGTSNNAGNPGAANAGAGANSGYQDSGYQNSGYQTGFTGQSGQSAGFQAATVKAESRGFFQALFDFSFSSFITIQFAKFIYIINIAIAALIYFLFVIAGFSGMGEDVGAGFLFGIGILLVGWIPALLQIVAVRLGLEGMIAVIRIAQNTAAIREASAGR